MEDVVFEDVVFVRLYLVHLMDALCLNSSTTQIMPSHATQSCFAELPLEALTFAFTFVRPITFIPTLDSWTCDYIYG